MALATAVASYLLTDLLTDLLTHSLTAVDGGLGDGGGVGVGGHRQRVNETRRAVAEGGRDGLACGCEGEGRGVK